MVSIHCPRGDFLTWDIYPFFQDWLNWWVLILHKTYDHWSLAVLRVTEHFIYSYFWFFQIGFALHWIQSDYPHLFCSLYDDGFPYMCDHQVGYSAGLYSLSPRLLLNWVYLSVFSGLAALMSADISQNLWSLVSSSLNSYWAFHLFPIFDFSQVGCFLHWILSVYPNSFCFLYDNGFPLYLWSPSGGNLLV